METIDMKTSELTGVALDWAVSVAEGHHYDIVDGQVVTGREVPITSGEFAGCMCDEVYSPSTDWAQGGPIIEREGIHLRAIRHPGHDLHGKWLAMFDATNTGTMVQWVKRTDFPRHHLCGSTPLIAAMRCFVASKIGHTVSIPTDLTT